MAALKLVEVVAVEGAGQGIVAREIVQLSVQAAGLEIGKHGPGHEEQGDQGRGGLAEQGPQQGGQRDAVEQGELGVRNGVLELKGPLLPAVAIPRR